MNIPVEELAEPFWNHVEALRSVLIRSLSVFAVGFVLALSFHQEILSLITSPLQQTQMAAASSSLQKQKLNLERIYNSGSETVKFTVPQHAHVVNGSKGINVISNGIISIAPGEHLDLETIESSIKLVIFGPVEGMVTAFKVCFWVSLVATAPFWLYFVLQFIVPAMKSHERRLLGPFLSLSAVFFVGGILFAYFVTLPLANAFLWAFNAEMGNNLWSLANYLDYTLFLLLANAFAFEVSLFLFFLVHLGVISVEWMTSHRRHMIITALVAAALLTPPDVPSQLMLAIPLIGLYEAAFLYARILAKRHKKPIKQMNT